MYIRSHKIVYLYVYDIAVRFGANEKGLCPPGGGEGGGVVEQVFVINEKDPRRDSATEEREREKFIDKGMRSGGG